jgi:hypothetical protein
VLGLVLVYFTVSAATGAAASLEASTVAVESSVVVLAEASVVASEPQAAKDKIKIERRKNFFMLNYFYC